MTTTNPSKSNPIKFKFSTTLNGKRKSVSRSWRTLEGCREACIAFLGTSTPTSMPGGAFTRGLDGADLKEIDFMSSEYRFDAVFPDTFTSPRHALTEASAVKPSTPAVSEGIMLEFQSVQDQLDNFTQVYTDAFAAREAIEKILKGELFSISGNVLESEGWSIVVLACPEGLTFTEITVAEPPTVTESWLDKAFSKGEGYMPNGGVQPTTVKVPKSVTTDVELKSGIVVGPVVDLTEELDLTPAATGLFQGTVAAGTEEDPYAVLRTTLVEALNRVGLAPSSEDGLHKLAGLRAETWRVIEKLKEIAPKAVVIHDLDFRKAGHLTVCAKRALQATN